MALRRLLSGWLIAVAALARSMALVLERAAADRPEPTPSSVPGPVMAALAERYPGAPDHWLALVAERTSRLAEAGAAPLSMSSQVSAWPASLPGAAGPLEPLMPMTPAGNAAISPEPPRSSPPHDAIPSLAALQGRSSEVWRRPQASPARRSRPVFAPVEPAPARVVSTSEGGAATGRRPRSPLTLETRPPSATPADMPSPVAPPAESVSRDWSGSEVSPVGVAEPAENAFATPSKTSPALEATRPETVSQPEPPQARRGDAWPVAPPTPRFLLDKAFSTGSPAPGFLALQPSVDVASRDASPLAVDRSADMANEVAEHQSSLSPPSRSVARRSIFRTLAALGARPRAAFLSSRQAAPKPASPGRAVTPPDLDGRSFTPRSDASGATPHSASSTATTPHAAAFEEDGPPVRVELRDAVAATPQAPRATWTPSFANDEAPRDPRASFAISRPSSTNASAHQAVRSSVDDRWPRFPPGLFAPLVVAEIPSPRLDQLAREQEEGRWSV